MLFLPRGAQIEIEYNLRRPSIWTIVRQVEALGYTVLVRPLRGRQEEHTHGFTSQCVGTYLVLIYPPPFDPQWNEEEIAREQNQQVCIDSVEVEITEDLHDVGRRPDLEYQRVIINWLQREYGEHVDVNYTLHEEHLAAENKGRHSYPTHRASHQSKSSLN